MLGIGFSLLEIKEELTVKQKEAPEKTERQCQIIDKKIEKSRQVYEVNNCEE